MAEDHARPNPDDLLEQVQAEERQRKRGRLVIFLGYAPGVGKTYAMLETARDLRQQGRDVVVGYVETHGRTETEALLAGLEIIPPRLIHYHDVTLREMDVDAVLARRPRIALVDELAHTNAPGSRHPKRYHDVEEVLDAGLDVYTTLNVQHLESLNDVVAQITGVVVRETVPDSVFDEAAEIILVDLPPDDLLQRLREGKVYVPDQAARAIVRFFRKGNLTALRELGLRRAAARVDDQMRAYMQTRAILGPWAAGERLLVCVSPSPLGERLVRSARRLADELGAEWFAIYVETPELLNASPEKKERVARTLQLAEELGAKTVTLPGNDVVSTVIDYARRHNITKIIAGKPLRSRWQEWLHGAVVDRLIRQSGDIDVYVVSSETPRTAHLTALTAAPERPWQRYGIALGLVLLAAIVSALVSPAVSPINIVMIFLLTVVVAAFYLGRGPSVLASIVSVLAFDFFFVPPHLTFEVWDAQYLLTFADYLVVGLLISQLTSQARGQAQAARQRERETATLFALSRDVAVAVGMDAIVEAIITNVGEALGRKVWVFLPSPDTGDVLNPFPRSAEPMDPNESAIAVWAFQHGQPAGRGTDTLPAARARYLPLKTVRGTVGVLAVEPADPAAHLTAAERRLLEGLASLSALAIERAGLVEQASQAQLLQVTEKLQQALLDSVSHDLRTPLVSITGALSTLADDADRLNEETRRALIETARDEADRLNRLVGNLLEMARIDAGALRTAREPGDLQDAVGSALQQIGPRLGGRGVDIAIPPDLPLAPMDFVLIVHVLVNLIENAMKYSPPEAPIEIRARAGEGEVVVEVADRGVGIPPEDLNRVFNKFYRVQRPENVKGTGLGLSISKSIIEAHGGRIWARGRVEGGSVIAFALPLEPAAPVAEEEGHA